MIEDKLASKYEPMSRQEILEPELSETDQRIKNSIIKDIILFAKGLPASYFSQSRKYNIDILNKLGIGLLDNKTKDMLIRKYGIKEIKRFKLDRFFGKVIIPVNEHYFIARNTDKDAKKKTLFLTGEKEYLMIQADSECLGIIFVEGETDALAAKHIYPNHLIISSGGAQTKIENKIDILNLNKNDYELLLAFDNDEEGQKATKRLSEYLHNNNLECFKLTWNTQFKDIDEVFREHGLKTAEHITKEKLEQQDLMPTITLKKMLADGVPKREFIVETLIPIQGVCIFGGRAGTYKTFFAMHLALSCASGTDFLQHFKTKKCNVLYVDEENGDITLGNRYKMLISGHKYECDFENINLSIFNATKLDAATCSNLSALIKKTNSQLIIIDSMVRCMSGDENDAADVKIIFENIKKLYKEYPACSFLILHHTTKDISKGMNGLRGSGDFAAFADTILMFQPAKNGVVHTSIVKNRHIDLAQCSSFDVEIDSDETEIEFKYKPAKDVNEAVLNCINAALGWFDDNKIDQFKAGEIHKAMAELGHSKNSVYKALEQMITDKDIEKLQRGKYKVLNKENSVSEEVIE